MNAVNQHNFECTIRRNGSGVLLDQTLEPAINSVPKCTLSVAYYMSASDYVELTVYQDTGSNQNMVTARFSAVKVGQ